MTFLRSVVVITTVMGIMGCLDEPINTNGDTDSYTPINVGNVRQLVDPMDSSTNLLCYIGNTSRTDGQKVFIQTWKYGTEIPETSYFFMQDGFLTSTNLDSFSDTVFSSQENPYNEHKIALAHPTEGFRWIQIYGDNDPCDMVANYIGEVHTTCCTFKDVFGIGLVKSITDSVPWLVVKYAPDVGWIETWCVEDTVNARDVVSLSYALIGNREYGELWPDRNKTIDTTDTTGFQKSRWKTVFMQRLIGRGIL